MINYELKAHLKHLVLSEEDGELGWIGTEKQWEEVKTETLDFELSGK